MASSQELTTFLARAAAFRAGGGPLHYCVLHGREQPAAAATRQLIDAGVPLDQQDSKGRSALALCALVGDARTATMLLAAGAEAALADTSGATALHACFSPAVVQQAVQEACSLVDSAGGPTPAPAPGGDRLAVAGLLLDHLTQRHVDAATDSERATPLMYAASAGSAAGVALLLASRANRDATDCRGRSALMLAASAGCTEAMQLLLQAAEGDPPHPTAAVDLASGEEGRTALCYAIEARQRAASELLLAAQARLDLVPKALLQQLVGLLFAGKQTMEAELREAQAASSKAAAASATSASGLKAATAERDAAQRTAADAERSAAAARQQAEAVQAEATALQRKLAAAEAAAAQLREEAAELRAQREAEAGRAAELQHALDGAAAQQAEAQQTFEERAAALELQAMEAAAAAEQERRQLLNEVDELCQQVGRWHRQCVSLREALVQERSKGFWARLFGGGKAKVAPEQEGWPSGATKASASRAGQPAAHDSWRSPRSQAPASAPGNVPVAGNAAAAAAECTIPEQPAMPASASASAGSEGHLELGQPACADQAGEGAPGEEAAGADRLGSAAATKGGPASAPAQPPDDPAATVSLKAQAGAGGAARAGDGGSMDGWEAAAGAAAGGGSDGIPAFRPVSQQLEAALEALLES